MYETVESNFGTYEVKALSVLQELAIKTVAPKYDTLGLFVNLGDSDRYILSFEGQGYIYKILFDMEEAKLSAESLGGSLECGVISYRGENGYWITKEVMANKILSFIDKHHAEVTHV